MSGQPSLLASSQAAVKEERFYVLTHPRIKGAIRARMEDILDERAPRNPLAL